MAEGNNKKPNVTEDKPLELHWYGMQFYVRAKGTGEITQRSFPFWAPSIEFAVDHAKKSNKLSKEERTYWTHVKLSVHIIETIEGSKIEKIEEKEIKV